MRYARACWAAAAIAVAFTALGAGTASATQICQVGVAGDGKCTTATTEAEYDGKYVVTSTNPVLTTNVATVTCEHSLLQVDPDTSTGSPITGSIISFVVTNNCKTNGGTKCEVSTVNLPYSASIENESMTITDATGIGFTVKCGFLINCTFVANEVEMEIEHSGSNIIKRFWNWLLSRFGGFCPETSTFDADYTGTNLTID